MDHTLKTMELGNFADSQWLLHSALVLLFEKDMRILYSVFKELAQNLDFSGLSQIDNL